MRNRLGAIEEKLKHSRPLTRHLFFIAFLLAAVLVFIPSLRRMVNLSLSSEMYSHLLLIPFVSVYLLYINREKLAAAPRPVNLPASMILLLAAFLLAAASFFVSDLSASVFLFVLLVWTGFVFFHGSAASREVLFPLFFLVFLVPAPSALLERIISFLLWGSDQVTAFLFSLSGVPFLHQDYVYRLPRLSIYIAPECSGIRSSTALLLTAVLADYLVLTRWWSRSILLLSVLPLAVFKNGLRIVTLSLLAIYVDAGFMSGKLHSRGGFVFFGITLAIMGILLLLLRKSELFLASRKTTEEGRQEAE